MFTVGTFSRRGKAVVTCVSFLLLLFSDATTTTTATIPENFAARGTTHLTKNARWFGGGSRETNPPKKHPRGAS